MPGAFLPISSNASESGIIWASQPLRDNANKKAVDGVLRAFDATDLGTELWNSEQAVGNRDQLGKFAKFSPPTIANGKVYVSTFSQKLVAYGVLEG